MLPPDQLGPAAGSQLRVPARPAPSLQEPCKPRPQLQVPPLLRGHHAPSSTQGPSLALGFENPAPKDRQYPLSRLLFGQRPSGGGRLLASPGVTAPLCSHSPAFGHSQGAIRSLLLRARCLDPFTHLHQAVTAHSSAAAQAAPATPRGPLPAPGAALPRHAPQQLRVSPSRSLQKGAILRDSTLPACFATGRYPRMEPTAEMEAQ